MKKKVLFLLIFICFSGFTVTAMNLEFTGGLGNINFNQERETALSAEDGAFSPEFFTHILARLSGEHNSIRYNAGFERLPILNNRFFGNIGIDFDYVSLESGFFLGLFNSSKLPVNPGIAAGLGLHIPGRVFVRAFGSSTLGLPMEVMNNYSQISGELSAGFWVPNVVASLNLSTQTNTVRKTPDLLIQDTLTRYFFRADVHSKGTPYKIRIDLGFEALSRTYPDETDEFKSIFLGFEGIYTVNPVLRLLIGVEMPVYSWGVRPLQDPPRGTMLFQARTGIIWTFR